MPSLSNPAPTAPPSTRPTRTIKLSFCTDNEMLVQSSDTLHSLVVLKNERMIVNHPNPAALAAKLSQHASHLEAIQGISGEAVVFNPDTSGWWCTFLSPNPGANVSLGFPDGWDSSNPMVKVKVGGSDVDDLEDVLAHAYNDGRNQVWIKRKPNSVSVRYYEVPV